MLPFLLWFWIFLSLKSLETEKCFFFPFVQDVFLTTFRKLRLIQMNPSFNMAVLTKNIPGLFSITHYHCHLLNLKPSMEIWKKTNMFTNLCKKSFLSNNYFFCKFETHARNHVIKTVVYCMIDTSATFSLFGNWWLIMSSFQTLNISNYFTNSSFQWNRGRLKWWRRVLELIT